MTVRYKINGQDVSREEFRKRRHRVIPGAAAGAGNHGGWPKWSDALGVNPMQIEEARKFHESHGIPAEFGPNGQMKILSMKHQRDVMRLAGLHDRNSFC